MCFDGFSFLFALKISKLDWPRRTFLARTASSFARSHAGFAAGAKQPQAIQHDDHGAPFVAHDAEGEADLVDEPRDDEDEDDAERDDEVLP